MSSDCFMRLMVSSLTTSRSLFAKDDDDDDDLVETKIFCCVLLPPRGASSRRASPKSFDGCWCRTSRAMTLRIPLFSLKKRRTRVPSSLMNVKRILYMSSPPEREKVTEEILLKRLDETTLEDLRTLNSVLFPVRYAVREEHLASQSRRSKGIPCCNELF